MKFRYILIGLICFFGARALGQQKGDILLWIDDKPIYTQEFYKVYNKNKEAVIASEDQDIDQYLNLFLEFKLKLISAYESNLDQNENFKNDYNKYREQLLDSYIKDEEIDENLIKSTYDRMLFEVNASHILIKCEPSASPADTLKAYQKIMEARERILLGDPFELVAKEFSEDPSVVQNGGNLSYFSAFDMVYPFEDKAYETAIGEVSMPFRTNFGYHILQVNDKRPAKGEIEVGHIFIKNKEGDTIYAQNQIQEIFQKIEQGEDFSFLAKKYSDDEVSASNEGKLPRFGTGRMIKGMEDEAFSLENIGDVTEPFQTSYGWHIFKLLQKYPIPTYPEARNGIVMQLQRGNRTEIVKKEFAERIAKNLVVKSVTDREILNLSKGNIINRDEIVLTIENETHTFGDFIDFSKDLKNLPLHDQFNQFGNEMIIQYYRDHLEANNEEVANTLQEYKDGLLLFELLENKIWKAAELDSIALQSYFNKNAENYFWKQTAHCIIANCNEKFYAEQVRKLLQEKMSMEEIKEEVNEGATIHVLFNESLIEIPSTKLPDAFDLKVGVSEVYEEDKNHYTVIDVLEIKPPRQKKLEECRGQVVNDFQNNLEREWIASLKETHEIKWNKKVVKQMKKTLEMNQ
ncbi:peptidylprolyl isomerase [Namhaeicola litoreus]|uniref:peptidylprolyl isomerase n=1 Tax=Namhaeicola litoreus TaxID=1052145 RepID=A0ABW3Y4J1_9FLAO